MKTTETAAIQPAPLTKNEEKVRARALYEAATVVMQMEQAWTDSERGTLVNKITARDAIIAKIDPSKY